MPKKIEIEFDVSFHDDKILPIPIGRLSLDGYVVRLVFTPEGVLKMTIPRGAIDKGLIIITEPISEEILFGLPPASPT